MLRPILIGFVLGIFILGVIFIINFTDFNNILPGQKCFALDSAYVDGCLYRTAIETNNSIFCDFIFGSYIWKDKCKTRFGNPTSGTLYCNSLPNPNNRRDYCFFSLAKNLIYVF